MKPYKKSVVLSLVFTVFLLSFLNLPNGKAQTVYTSTFNPEANISGVIRMNGISYPPSTNQTKYFPSYYFQIGQYRVSLNYTLRSYISFNTSTLLDNIYIVSSKLYVAPALDQSDKDFKVYVYSGQNQWVSNVTCTWNKCPTYEGVIFNTNGVIELQYYNISVGAGNINTSGRTQFRLLSGNEGTMPQPSPTMETINLFNSTDADWHPYLQVSWRYLTPTATHGINVLQANTALSDALGLGSPFLGGLIISFMIVLGFIILPCAVLQAPLLAYASLIGGALGIFVVLGWLPIWSMFMEVLIVVICISSMFSKWASG